MLSNLSRCSHSTSNGTICPPELLHEVVMSDWFNFPFTDGGFNLKIILTVNFNIADLTYTKLKANIAVFTLIWSFHTLSSASNVLVDWFHANPLSLLNKSRTSHYMSFITFCLFLTLFFVSPTKPD